MRHVIPLRDDNPSKTVPVVTIALLAAVAAVFLSVLSLGPSRSEAAVYALGLIPGALFGQHKLAPELALLPPAATILTSMFVHGGWLHLLGNMLYLWIYGDNVEDAMGHAKFLVFYLLCGTVAALAQALPDPHSTVPMIGASGAISGVLGAYLVLFPRARIAVLIPLGFFLSTARLSANVVLVWWFVLQFLSTVLSPEATGGVAFRAHVGGFVAGIALVAIFRRPGVPLFNPFTAR